MDAPGTTPGQRRTILVGVCLALMAVVASVSGLNVAQPQLAQTWNASPRDVLWMINIYTVTLAALLLPLGALGDRWGHKPVLLIGLLVFAGANLAAGLAPSPGVLLGARLLAGVGAALVMPTTLSLITATFPPGERSQAIGIWTAVSGAGGIVGMFVSSVLVDLATWRWIFLLPIVLVAGAFPLAARAIPQGKRIVPRPAYDGVGAVTSMLAVVGATLVLTEGPHEGWFSVVSVVGAVAAVTGTVAFVLWERAHPAPLLDVRLFGDRRLATGSVALLAVFGVPSGIFLVLYPFFQSVLGWTSLESTLALMPMLGVMIVCSGLAPRLASRVGVRRAMATGISLGASGLALMAVCVSVDGGYLSILPGYVLMGVGMGLTMTPATEAITSALPPERQGVASAVNDVARELGSGLGIALLGSVLAAGATHAMATRQPGLAPGAGPLPSGPTLTRLAQECFVQGWQQAMGAGVIVMLLVLVYVLALGPRAFPILTESSKKLS